MSEPATINASCLSHSIIAACLRLLKSRDIMNELNVFPVPDGDTGTNMAATVCEMAGALKLIETDDAVTVLRVAAKAAIMGARGNSGAILAQFVCSVAEQFAEAGKQHELDPDEFIRACVIAAHDARAAIDKPVEGTILTVIGKWAKVLDESSGTFEQRLHNSLVSARNALNLTQHQLPELTAAGVVDAGGLGFVTMVEGALEYLRTGTYDDVPQVIDTVDLRQVAHVAHAAESLSFRFCTECVIEGKNLSASLIKSSMRVFGDSMVVAGSKRMIRLHIHTNEPQVVFSQLASFGRVTGEKAEDMQQQARSFEQSRGHKTCLVTDSCCDLPPELMTSFDIRSVPLRLDLDGVTFIDKVTIQPKEFYERLPTLQSFPKTSQPPQADFNRAYDLAASHSQEALSIHVSSKVSGTWQAAKLAGQKSSLKVEIVDSENVSVGLGLLVLEAAQWLKNGRDLNETKQHILSLVQKTKTILLPYNIDYMIRGGRLTGLKARILKTLRLKPLLMSHEGGIKLAGITLTGRFGQSFAAYLLIRRIKKVGRVKLAIAHANNPELARYYCRKIIAACDVSSHYVTEFSPVLGVYAGPRSCAIAFLPDEDQ